MRLQFGRSSEGKLPGKIDLRLPDEARSFVAGTFTIVLPGETSNSKEVTLSGEVTQAVAPSPPASLAPAVQKGTQSILYLATANGLIRVDESGQHDVIVGGVKGSYCLQVSEGKLYASSGTRGTPIRSYSLEGELLGEFAVPDQAKGYLTFARLPGERFALLDNRKDQIHFVDHTGALITTVRMGAPDNRAQSLDTVVVDNSLYVVEVGESRVLEVRLDTYEASLFKDLSAQLRAVSCIAYSPHTGLFYAGGQNRGLYSFSKTKPIERVSSRNAGYAYYADVEIDFPRAYVMGTKGAIMIMDLQTGLFQELCDLQVRTRSMGLHIASDNGQ